MPGHTPTLKRETMTPNDAVTRAIQRTDHQGSSMVRAGQILCLIVPMLIWFSPLEIEPRTRHMFAIGAFMIIAWITQAAEFALAGFIGCFLFWALRVVPFQSRSPASRTTRPGSCSGRC